MLIVNGLIEKLMVTVCLSCVCVCVCVCACVCVCTCLVYVNMRPCMHIVERGDVSKLDLDICVEMFSEKKLCRVWQSTLPDIALCTLACVCV